MRKRTERMIAIGAVATVAVVPSVLVLLPHGLPNPLAEPGENPVAQQLPVPPVSPSPSASPSPTTSGAVPQNNGNQPVAGGPSTTGGGVAGGNQPKKRKPGTYLASDSGAKVTKVARSGARQLDVSVKSPALGGTTQRVRLLVPKTWRADAQRTWPVVYAYHGGRDTSLSWTRSTNIEAAAARYDVIVAMPDGANGSYADWYNGGKGGNPRWETFHTSEVRQLLERNFNVGSSRAAMGLSSGGQGAITYAARHSGMFKYAASFSGVLSMLSPGIPSLLMYINSGPNATKIWGDPVTDRANWAAHDPTTQLRKLRGTRLFVSSGNGKPGPFDPAGSAPWDIRYLSETQVHRSTGDFVERARKLGIPVTSDFYGDGSHSWGYWQREMNKIWPSMMSSIGAPRAK